MTYDLGGVAVLSFTALDVTGAPANATTCTLTITQPDGTVMGPTTLVGTAGVYSYYFTTQQSGRHTYRFLATGTPGAGVGVGAYDDVFDVYGSTPVSLVSLADTKKLLRTTTALFDDDLRFFNEAVTGIIDKHCGPMVPRLITAERHTAGARTLMLRKIPVYQPVGQAYPIVSITPVLTYGVPYPDLSLLSVDKVTGEVMHTIGLPFWYGAYDLSYWAGRAVIPSSVLLAAQVILKHWWAMERGGSRPGANSPGAADDVTMLYGFAIPNRALEMLESERTPAGFA